MATRVETWTARLIEHASLGTVVDLKAAADKPGVPDPDTKWPASRVIPAEAIVAALTQTSTPLHRAGLRIRGARITGSLDLTLAVLSVGLEVRASVIDEDVVIEDATLPWLTITRTAARGVRGARVEIRGNLNLNGVTVRNPGGYAVNLDAAHIGGSAFLGGGFEATGEVRLLNATVTGALSLKGAKLSNPNGCALRLDRAQISGGMLLDEGFEATGEVRAVSASIIGQLSLSGAKLNNPDGDALTLDSAQISGAAFLDDGFEATGQVSAHSATINGQLSLRGAKLSNPDGRALSLVHAQIRGDAFLNDGFEATGQVNAHSATINGQLSLRGAKLSNPDGDALYLDGAQISGVAFLDKGFEATGQVNAHSATINGQLSLRGAKLSNPDGRALNLDQAQIGGDAFLDEGFEATGQVNAHGATVNGQLRLTGAKLSNSDGYALSLVQAQIIGGAFLNNGFEATGEVRALGATISGQLNLRGAKISNPEGNALTLEGTKVLGTSIFQLDVVGGISLNNVVFESQTEIRVGPQAGGIAARPFFHAWGAKFDWLKVIVGASEGPTFDLARATVRRLEVDGVERLALTGAAGWSIGTVHGELLSKPREVVRMLDRVHANEAHAFVAQPWKEFASAVERAGEPEYARRLRWQAARRTTSASPLLSRIFIRVPYGLVVGYGYFPLLTLAWIFGLWLAVFGIAYFNQTTFLPTDYGLAQSLAGASSSDEIATLQEGYPSFDPALFALDVAVPAANTGQAASWQLQDNTLLAAIFGIVKTLSWGLTALLIAGVTGILRKD